MKYIVFIALIITSCQPKKKTAIDGKWLFERNELYPGVTTNPVMDSLLQVLTEGHKGFTLEFRNNIFYVTQVTNGAVNDIAKQPFTLTTDQKILVLENRTPPNDSFPIVFLNDSILKLNMYLSNDGYPVFRKID